MTSRAGMVAGTTPGAPRSDYETLFEKAKAFHGHVCPGIVLGTRLTMAGLRELGMDLHDRPRNLIVYMEIDRCGADAVQAITGCSLGHRSLKHVDYGKFAATFVDITSGKAVRVAIQEKNREHHDNLEMEEVIDLLGKVPEDEILKIDQVRIKVPKDDFPGYPGIKEKCCVCGEFVLDNRHIRIDGKSFCKSCGFSSYYEKID